MDRRTLLVGLAAISPSLLAGALSTRKIARVGIITSGLTAVEVSGPNPKSESVAAFLRGMRDLGYEYGEFPFIR